MKGVVEEVWQNSSLTARSSILFLRLLLELSWANFSAFLSLSANKRMIKIKNDKNSVLSESI